MKSETRIVLNTKINELSSFCTQNGIPLFIATWDEDSIHDNAGYSYQTVPFSVVDENSPQPAKSSVDKMALFIRAAEGHWKKDGESIE